MYLSDIHTHSIASGHGTTCTISDMAKAASRKGSEVARNHRPRSWNAGRWNFFLFPQSDLCAEEAFWN